MAPLVGTLGESLSVYYCTDDYAAFPGVDAAAVRALDDELTRRADIVFATSETLVARKQQLNAETHFSPHGVDFEHFRRALDPSLAVPDDAARLTGPVVGFFGLIGSWIDLDLVAWLADQRPDWTFLMIGRAAASERDIPQRPNLVFLGAKPYETLPAYGKRFDVAIIPYRHGDQTFHANPLKLREYLAMGKPIVSVSTPVIDQFSAWVSVAHSQDEFLAALDRAIGGNTNPEATRRQLQAVSEMTWDARLNRVLEIVCDRLSARARCGELGDKKPRATSSSV